MGAVRRWRPRRRGGGGAWSQPPVVARVDAGAGAFGRWSSLDLSLEAWGGRFYGWDNETMNLVNGDRSDVHGSTPMIGPQRVGISVGFMVQGLLLCNRLMRLQVTLCSCGMTDSIRHWVMFQLKHVCRDLTNNQNHVKDELSMLIQHSLNYRLASSK